MINHLELAQLSKQIYFKDGGFVPGWNALTFYDDGKGFAAGVYEKPNANITVIAFRGTDTANLRNFIHNLYNGLQIAMGKNLPLLKQANDFVKKVRDEQRTYIFKRIWKIISTLSSNQLYLTGHSLGGLLASFVGYSMLDLGKDYKVVAFESVGIGDFVNPEHLKRYEKKFKNNFITYLAGPNPVNSLMKHLGVVRRLALKPHSHTSFIAKGSHFYKHSVNCIANDILRAVLLLLALNIFATLFEIHLLPSKFYQSIDLLPRYLKETSPISYLNPNAPTISFCFFLVSLMVLLTIKLTEQTLSAFSHQHRIEAIINEFTKNKGEPVYIEMVAWPTLKQYLGSQAYHLLNWLNPHNHPSVINITRAEELHEQNIQAMMGYQEAKPSVKPA